jgi:hypothetical protein
VPDAEDILKEGLTKFDDRLAKRREGNIRERKKLTGQFLLYFLAY